MKNQNDSPDYQVAQAIKNGTLKRPSNCEWCGRPYFTLHGHHEDYTKPLDVMWLCPSCHRLRHNRKILLPIITKVGIRHKKSGNWHSSCCDATISPELYYSVIRCNTTQ